jgi:hypothetical protein
MGLWATVWIVLMLFWLFFGCYTGWDPARPAGLGNTLIPWCCVAILGAIVLGGLPH